jgi:outer membrane protein assembly factor BamB
MSRASAASAGAPATPQSFGSLQAPRSASLAIVVLLSAVWATPALAGNWPAWRGPDGNGTCRERNLPLHWATNENVRWRVPLPDRGNSTPIVWGDHVYLTQAISRENRRTVMCFDRHDGKLLWQAGPAWTEKDPTHDDNPQCSPSPVTDGRRVIAWFGSAGVYCYDDRGRELWRQDLGRQSHQWGYAASPVLYRDLCLLNFGPGQRSFLIALDKRTGRTVWKHEVSGIGADAKWTDFGGEAKYDDQPGAMKVSDVAGSWSTPVVVPAGGRDELVVAYPLRLMALAPKTGAVLWTCGGPNIGAYSSPFFGDGVVGVAASGFTNTLMAVRPGGRGDVAGTHRLWLLHPANSKACLGSGVIFRGHIYQAAMMGFAQCLDLKTGQTIWEERLTGTGARNSSWSSPVLAGDRLYVANQNADVFVLRASARFECLATNSIGGEPMNASPAVSDGQVFLRTDRHLWCIGAVNQR